MTQTKMDLAAQIEREYYPHAFPPASSAGDPATSFEAEGEVNRSGKRRRHVQIVLEEVMRRPGLTARELGLHTGLGHIETQRRLSDLKNADPPQVRQGKPVMTTSGRRMVTWWDILTPWYETVT